MNANLTMAPGRSYKIEGMDCAEEVAVLKQSVGPIVGGAEQLAFDVLNGRMTVMTDANSAPDEAIVKAVASTGMRAIPWASGSEGDSANALRRQQTVFAAASGVCVLIGFVVHIVMAGGS